MRELKYEEVEQVGDFFGLTVAAIAFSAALVGKLAFAGSVHVQWRRRLDCWNNGVGSRNRQYVGWNNMPSS